MKRVVITGMGVISPLGNDVNSFWNQLVKGQSGISLIDSFDTADYKTKIAGIVRDFDADEILGRKEAKRLDRFSQFALAAAEQALENSQLQLDNIDLERLGVYVGSGIGGIQSLVDNVNVLNKRGPARVSPSLVPMMISNAAAAQISIKLGAQGPSLSPVTACSIGNTSIGEAFNAIEMMKQILYLPVERKLQLHSYLWLVLETPMHYLQETKSQVEPAVRSIQIEMALL